MDNLGNRTSVTKRDTAADTYALDSATNRYDASTGGPYDVTCAYDAAGNTTQDKDNYTYWYDYENRVVKIEKPDGLGGWNDVAEMAYDALGRRIMVIDSNEAPEHCWYMPHFGLPPWKKCYMRHIRITCWLKGVKGPPFLELQFPYGPCYKYRNGVGGIIH